MPMVLAFCPLCCAPVCGLRHLVIECSYNADLREGWTVDLRWILQATASSANEAAFKLRLVGCAVARAAEALGEATI